MFPLDRGERRGRAVARRELRPRGVGVRSEPLVRPVPLDPGGAPAPSPGRAARLPDEQPAQHPLRRRGAGLDVRDASASAARDASRSTGREDGVEFHLGHGDMIERPARQQASRSSALIELYAPDDAETHPSTTPPSPPSGRGSGRRRRYGQPERPADPRLDVAAAAGDPRAARDSVRGRSRPTTSRTIRPTPSRPSSFVGTRRERRARSTSTAESRSASTRPSCSTGGSTARPPARNDAGRMLRRAVGADAHRRLRRLPPRRGRRRRRARADRRDLPARSRRTSSTRTSRAASGRGAPARTRSRGSAADSSSASRATTSTSSGSRARSSSRSSSTMRQSCCKHAGRLAAPHGLVQVRHRVRRPRHGRRPRHRQHARLRARARHRALRAVRRRDRPAHGRGARRRRRGEADARAHARDDLGDPPAEGRRHRRLRRHRADAPPLHPEGAPAPLRASARRRVRAVGRHRRREARGRGGDALGRRAPGLPHRGADGRRDRRRPAGRRADREHDRRHRRRHHRGRRHLARRHRRLPEHACRRRRDGRGDRQPHQEGVQAPRRPADGRGDQARDRLRATA